MRIAKADVVVIVISFVVLVVVGVVGEALAGQAGSTVFLATLAILLLGAMLEMYRRLNHQLSEQQQGDVQNYRQVEAFLSLLFTIKPSLPLPRTREWAASPDFLLKIAEVILREKPRLVVEASSGVSTVVIAYCLKRLGKGKVVSLEHDPKFAAINQGLLSFHGLDDLAKVVYAPLKKFEIKEQKWLWYDTDCLMDDQVIDLLVIDGPPADVQRLSRYPALPLLFKHLNRRTSILLDDGRREDEKTIVSLWEREFEDLLVEFVDLEKGAFVIEKHDREVHG